MDRPVSVIVSDEDRPASIVVSDPSAEGCAEAPREVQLVDDEPNEKEEKK